MKIIISFLVASCAVVLCQSAPMENQWNKNMNACKTIKRTVKNCVADQETVTFTQSLRNSQIVMFIRTGSDHLKIKCFAQMEIQLNNLPKVDFSEVTKIELEQCILSNNLMLKKIKESFNLTKVETLKIETTQNKDNLVLTKEFFQSFSKLKNIELAANNFITLDENVFEWIANLKTIKLLVHDVIALPYNVFTPLKELETLLITSNGRAKDETKTLNFTLKQCINLRNFRVEFMRYPVNVGKLLSHNSRMESVSIVNNKIITLSEDVFYGSREIETIELFNNNLTTLPGKVFSTQSDLMKIDLSRNQLETLDEGLFEKNKDLLYINISHNKLKFISRKLFTKLVNLLELDLSHNQMTEISFASNIGNLTSLRVLKLSNNFISSLQEDLKAPALTYLDLMNNNLTRFFIEQFWTTSGFDLEINLQENSLESVDFRNVNSSRSNTKLLINTDDEITCNCHTISLYNFLHRRLSVSQNIYDAIKISPLEIHCKKNGFDAPTTVMDIYPDELLCPLNLPHQIFCTEPCRCARRPSDETLSFACNNVSSIPNLPQVRLLKDVKLDQIELKVSGNSIDRLPSKFRDRNYNDVTAIYASRNIIQVLVSENIPDRLVYLDLSHNRLNHVASNVIARFETLDFLQLYSNPWNCLESIEIVVFVKTHRKIVRDFSEIKCSSNTYFLEVETENKCIGQIFSAILIVLGLLSIAAAFFACRRFKQRILEWIFAKDNHHLIERVLELKKVFDGTLIAADHDRFFGKYITTKLNEKPNQFKVGYFTRLWAENEPIPKNVLENLRKSRRAIIVLSEYFNEDQWNRWNYFNTHTRVIFIKKGKSLYDINIPNSTFIDSSDPWFWEKLKHAMVSYTEFCVNDEQTNIELQPLNCITSD